MLRFREVTQCPITVRIGVRPCSFAAGVGVLTLPVLNLPANI